MGKIYLLNDLKFDGVENLEVFKIEYIENEIALEKYDALIFTSKNAIYSLNSFNETWKSIPSYAIAPKTAKIIEKEGGRVEYMGSSGHGDDFAKEIASKLKNKKVLYIKALKVASNLVEILKQKHINIDELITYKTTCNTCLNKKLEKNSVIVFTSPSSVNCFFKNFIWDNSFKAVVIGKTTAKSIPKGINYEISSKTSVEECIKLAQNIIF